MFTHSSFSKNQFYNFATLASDHGGCGFYRNRFVAEEISQQHQNCFFLNSDNLLLFSENIFRSISSIRLFRICSHSVLPWFRKVLLPAKEKYHFKILFEIDDILLGELMPEYNLWRKNFFNTKDVLQELMTASDLITTTTKQLVDFYEHLFGIPHEKFRIIPNYIPQYCMDFYIPGKAYNRWLRHQGKLRIGFLASPSHFTLTGASQQDDISGIKDWIIANRKNYRFVFMGGLSDYLKEYASDFEVYPIMPFLHFFHTRQKLDLDLLIAPLAKNEFNLCKSDIKITEAWAAGTPVFAQDVPNYLAIMPEFCFDSADKLETLIMENFKSPANVQQIVDSNYAKMDRLWLHNHVGEWLDVLV